jgi:hypothetical protein
MLQTLWTWLLILFDVLWLQSSKQMNQYITSVRSFSVFCQLSTLLFLHRDMLKKWHPMSCQDLACLFWSYLLLVRQSNKIFQWFTT